MVVAKEGQGSALDPPKGSRPLETPFVGFGAKLHDFLT